MTHKNVLPSINIDLSEVVYYESYAELRKAQIIQLFEDAQCIERHQACDRIAKTFLGQCFTKFNLDLNLLLKLRSVFHYD